MRSIKELCRLISIDMTCDYKGGGSAVIFDTEDARTMRYIGINVASLIGVTLLLIIGAMSLS